jgi:hypothetical protein
VVTVPGYRATGPSVGQRVFALADRYRDGSLAECAAVEARSLAPLPGDLDKPSDLGPYRVTGIIVAVRRGIATGAANDQPLLGVHS